MERNLQLDMLPTSPVRSQLQDYDFTSAEASQRFEELVDSLRQQRCRSPQPDDVGDAERDAAADAAHEGHAGLLNQMLEKREPWRRTPASKSFMERYG